MGVDVERCRPLNDCQAIARRFFTKREADWLEGFRGAALDRAFFRLWTRKEAILKSTGEGISGGLDSLELLAAGGSFRPVVIRSAGGAAEQGWGLTELVPAAGFAGALALPADAGRVELQAATYPLA